MRLNNIPEKTNTKLTEDQVINIYNLKLSNPKMSAPKIIKELNLKVSPVTVRDIINNITWTDITSKINKPSVNIKEESTPEIKEETKVISRRKTKEELYNEDLTRYGITPGTFRSSCSIFSYNGYQYENDCVNKEIRCLGTPIDPFGLMRRKK